MGAYLLYLKKVANIVNYGACFYIYLVKYSTIFCLDFLTSLRVCDVTFEQDFWGNIYSLIYAIKLTYICLIYEVNWVNNKKNCDS